MTLRAAFVHLLPTEGPPLIILSMLGVCLSLWTSLSLQDVQINFPSLWVFQKRKSENYLNKGRLITSNQKFCTYQVQISFQVWVGCTTQIHTNIPPFSSFSQLWGWQVLASVPQSAAKKDNLEAGICRKGGMPLPGSGLPTIPKFSLLTLISYFYIVEGVVMQKSPWQFMQCSVQPWGQAPWW